MPPTGHHAFMRKEGEEKIIKIPMNEWARYRKQGYVFSNELEFNAQRAAEGQAQVEAEALAEALENLEPPTMVNTKIEILEYVAAKNIDVDEDATKTQLLEAIDDAQENDDDD